MGWGIGIICVIAVIIVGVAIATKADKKRFKEDYQKLSKEEKALITEEEYIKRRDARALNPQADTKVVEVPQIIKCPVCGQDVSNKAKTCPHCGHPIDTAVYCPKCGSKNTEPISGTSKVATTWAVGAYAANTVVSKYRCKDCGHKF